MPKFSIMESIESLLKQRNQQRKALRKARRQLSAEHLARLGQQISRRLIQTAVFRRAKHIAYYLPVQGEADPTLLLNHAFTHQKTFYLPIISRLKKNHLFFAPINKNTRYKLNQYRIPEPICPPNKLRKARELDLVITPLVGFDKQGNRLGMGGGYYDHSFAFKRHRKHYNKPLLVGYAYAFQELDELSFQAWDVPLDAIVTEKKFTWF